MTKKFFSKVLILALVISLFGAINFVNAAPSGGMDSTAMTISADPEQDDPVVPIQTITVTDAGGEITDANNLRIKIPSTINVTWDDDATATIGGDASAIVNGAVTYSADDRILILEVTADFTPGWTVTISDLGYVPGLTGSAADDLEWSVDGGATYGEGGSDCYITVVEGLVTTTEVGNVSPVITQTPGDNGSDDSNDFDCDPSSECEGGTDGNPNNVGDVIDFTVNALDVNGDQYYFAVCKDDEITANASAAPTCSGGNGEWAIGGPVDSEAAFGVGDLTYLTTGSETCDENCAWYAFVCDGVASSPACFPATGVGDQGSAMGTVTISTDVPADGETVTVDSLVYEFDTGGACSGGEDVCVNCYDGVGVDDPAGGGGGGGGTACADEADAAYELADVDNGASSYMVSRGTIVYAYADADGSAGNALTLSAGTCGSGSTYCSVSGATFSGGDTDNRDDSPFYINHKPTFDGSTPYAYGDTENAGLNHASGSVEPGDTLYVSAYVHDTDTDAAQDTVKLFVCNSDSFSGGVAPACGGTELCSSAYVDPTADYPSCGFTEYTAIPTAHDTYSDIYTFVVDIHGFAATEASNRSYTVEDVRPELVGYTATDSPAPPAGGSDTVDFSVSLTDDNGDGDVDNIEGFFLNDTIVDADCDASENDCYIHASCTPSDTSGVTDPSAPDHFGTGSDNALGADCQVTVWFNADYDGDGNLAQLPLMGILPQKQYLHFQM
jgi:hypothetical protein